jgi:hypothetical protein
MSKKRGHYKRKLSARERCGDIFKADLDAPIATELKKCPFCGGPAQFFPIETEYHGTWWQAKCIWACNAQQPPTPSKEQSAELWNRREKLNG